MSSELPARPGAAPTSIASAAPSRHRVAVEERGSFCFASCSCGWFAPGRRSRDRARRDTDEHLADPEPAS
ncbi:hypothetical protein [Kitasatospora sp. GP82]|uniref:hypothetical protein n=1 Tax=Kitasatospora sp. GP82 TaxID=3035089 RepID=UPI00247362F3|nr:hypothetical protein [Kitasatospora sp. GP82]MDH6126325.1 hypothetical protein [Kitasatospora sp. GP82]